MNVAVYKLINHSLRNGVPHFAAGVLQYKMFTSADLKIIQNFTDFKHTISNKCI